MNIIEKAYNKTVRYFRGLRMISVLSGMDFIKSNGGVEKLGREKANTLSDKYKIGTGKHWNGATVFW